MPTQVSRLRELSFHLQPPHDLQLKIVDSFDKFPVTVCGFGRQGGKSSTRPYAITDRIRRLQGFTFGAYVGPSHGDALKAFEEDLHNFGRVGLVKDFGGDDQDRHIDYYGIVNKKPLFPGTKIEHFDGCICAACAEYREVQEALNGKVSEGCRVYYVSGGPIVHRAFQKHKLQWAIVDEMSHEATDLLEETILPMFATTDGHLLGIGSPIPLGINFAGFGDLYQMGVPGSDTYDPSYHSMNSPTEANPYVNKARIAAQRKALVDAGKHALAACLYDGRFVSDFGATFTNQDAVFVLKARELEPDRWVIREARPSESFVISIDFGRHDDSTVVWVVSMQTLEAVEVMRVRRTEYLIQLPIIDKLVKRYPRRQIWAEGREETAAELLRRMYGDSVTLIKWSSGGVWDKATCVAKGMDLFERGAWRLPNIRWIRDEFEQFQREKTPSGKWTYNAPKGKHDDSVAALLYATYALPLMPTVPPEEPVEAPIKWPEERFSLAGLMSPPTATIRSPFVLRRR